MEYREPCPLFAGLAPQGSDSRHTREIEQHEEHEAEGGERCKAGGTQVSAIKDGERRDNRFFRRQTGDKAYGHLPVEA